MTPNAATKPQDTATANKAPWFKVVEFNYSHRDYNEPAWKREYDDRSEAIETGKKRFAGVTYGRVDVYEMDPATGLSKTRLYSAEQR